MVTVTLDGKRRARARRSPRPPRCCSTAALSRTTPVSGSPRAPYCMMGVCFDCLMEIDGVPNRQACLVTVAEGMRIRRQQGARQLTA